MCYHTSLNKILSDIDKLAYLHLHLILFGKQNYFLCALTKLFFVSMSVDIIHGYLTASEMLVLQKKDNGSLICT